MHDVTSGKAVTICKGLKYPGRQSRRKRHAGVFRARESEQRDRSEAPVMKKYFDYRGYFFFFKLRIVLWSLEMMTI